MSGITPCILLPYFKIQNWKSSHNNGKQPTEIHDIINYLKRNGANFKTFVFCFSDFVILTCKRNMLALQKSGLMVADGTFDKCPTGFSQVYIVSGKINTFNMPLAYILLKNKKEETYLSSFRRLKQLCHELTGKELSPSIFLHVIYLQLKLFLTVQR